MLILSLCKAVPRMTVHIQNMIQYPACVSQSLTQFMLLCVQPHAHFLFVCQSLLILLLANSVKAGGAFKASDWGGAICEAMTPAAEDVTIQGKRGLCGFASTNLDFVLRQKGIETILLAGFLVSGYIFVSGTETIQWGPLLVWGAGLECDITSC